MRDVTYEFWWIYLGREQNLCKLWVMGFDGQTHATYCGLLWQMIGLDWKKK
jgi:hypothetical protein